VARVVTQPLIMTSPSPRPLVAAVLLAGALLTGCKQGAGERCEVGNDCQSGLTCQKLNNSDVGQCKDPALVAPTADAAPMVDTRVQTPDAHDAASDPAPATPPEAGPEAAPADHPADAPADAALDAPSGS
jgi:hypothetical protein